MVSITASENIIKLKKYKLKTLLFNKPYKTLLKIYNYLYKVIFTLINNNK